MPPNLPGQNPGDNHRPKPDSGPDKEPKPPLCIPPFCPDLSDLDPDAGKKIFISGNDIPDITANADIALSSGQPATLHYIRPGHPRHWWDYERNNPNPCYRNKISGLSCEEYPFASSAEGGERNQPTLRLVPRSQQSTQGARLGAFYTVCKVVPNDPIEGEFEVRTSMNAKTGHSCPGKP